MTLRRFARLQLTAAVAVVAWISASCADDQKHYSLADGFYLFDPVFPHANNTCWDLFPPASRYDFTISTDEATFSLETEHPFFSVVVPSSLSGERVGRDLEASGESVVTVTSACALSYAIGMSGRLMGEDRFDAAFDVVIDANTLTTSGQPSDCSSLAAGSIVPLVDFPTLSNPTNGSCALTVQGEAER